jgi:hypothetical protein
MSVRKELEKPTMRSFEKRILSRNYALVLAAACFASLPGLAADFTWADGDLLLGFRQVGGASELVVDLGRATNWNQWAAANPGVATNVTPALFNDAFPGAKNNIFWSAFAANATDHFLWGSKPRIDFQVQSIPWLGRSTLGQSAGLNPIHATGANAVNFASSSNPRALQTANEVVLPLGLPGGYQYEVTVQGRDLYGAHFGYVGFQDGSVGVENNTPADFDAMQQTNRIDFFYIPAVVGQPGKYLGYFDLTSDGVLYFTAAGPNPGLTQVSPANGPTGGGTLITLTGSNFVSGLSVRFADVPASTVNFSNSTLVTVITPPNVSGVADVMLINPDGQWSTLSGAFEYTGGGNPAPPAPTAIITVTGGNVVLVSIGATNGTLQILSSADVTAPVGSWTSVVTNSVGADGLFTNTLPIDPGEAQRYYRLAIP